MSVACLRYLDRQYLCHIFLIASVGYTGGKWAPPAESSLDYVHNTSDTSVPYEPFLAAMLSQFIGTITII